MVDQFTVAVDGDVLAAEYLCLSIISKLYNRSV